MKKETPNKYYSNKEIGTALNNAVVCTSGALTLKNVNDGRKRQLRAYTSAILDNVLQHRKDGHLTAEELVYVLSTASLFVQVLLISKNGVRLPMFEDIAADIAKDQAGV